MRDGARLAVRSTGGGWELIRTIFCYHMKTLSFNYYRKRDTALKL